MIDKIKGFLSDVVVELGKVSWPDKEELIGSTLVVIVGTLIMTVVIGICDFIFSSTVHIVMR